MALGAAAAVTERIRLLTSVLNVPWRGNAAVIAKQAASVDVISGGRLDLGVGLGGRDDDYEAAGVPTAGRGKRLEEMLERMTALWGGERAGMAGGVGPEPLSGPSLILGGSVDAAYRRAARFGTGWMAGGAPPDAVAQAAEATRAAFADAGRSDAPRIMALAYFALGPEAERMADWYIHDYYAFLGDFADQMAASIPTSQEALRGALRAYEEAGCDELVLLPCATDPEQVDLLADAVL